MRQHKKGSPRRSSREGHPGRAYRTKGEPAEVEGIKLMRHANWRMGLGVVALTGALATGAQAITTDPTSIANDGAIDTPGAIEHCDEVVPGRDFNEVFDCGDELFSAPFNDVDGAGGNVGDGGRFTRVPRTDQNGPNEWANHRPPRATGPNSNACVNCHAVGAEDGAGEVSSNNVRDPLGTNDPGRFIQRNPPHIFGMGGVQMLAETFNTALLADVSRAMSDATAQGRNVTRALETQGVNFGSVTATAAGQVTIDAQGVDRDLVVKPFDWSGVLPTVRSFIRDAAHQELGMNPVETAGDDVDGDFDGVVNEFLIEDVTALTIYQAAQPRPVTTLELNALRQNLNGRGEEGRQLAVELGLPILSNADIVAINVGARIFNAIGCDNCHVPALQTAGRIFSEPSQNPNYREAVFPAGQNAVARDVDPADPVSYDATADQPDNVIMVGNEVVARLGAFERNGDSAVVRLFGDLKRHDMGPGLAENIDAGGNGAATFITENLWGVGSTPQYLHDGRATTIREAIREHGGEAQDERNRYFNLGANSQRTVIRFLKNLVLFKVVEEEE